MNIKPWQAIVILAVFGALLWSAVWAGAEWRKFQGPGVMRVDHDGNLYVRVVDKILVYSTTMEYLQTIDLRRWGIKDPLGGFDVFSNGDLLMQGNDGSNNEIRRVLDFLFVGKLLPDKLTVIEEKNQGRLLRCSPSASQCMPLPALQKTFANNLRLLIAGDNTIFMADTVNNKIYWLAEDGAVLDELNEGFRLPGQIAMEDNAILVANTSKNEITRIPLEEQKFSRKSWQHMNVKISVANEHAFPVEVIAANGYRYILQKVYDMMQGIVLRYDSKGNYIPPVYALPEGSDIMSIALLGDELLVSDYASRAIWRFGANAKSQGRLVSPQLDKLLDAAEQQKNHYRMLQYASWGVFGLLVMIGFAAGVATEVQRNRKQDGVDAEAGPNNISMQKTAMPLADDPAIHWIEKNEKFFKQIKWLGMFMLLMLPLSVVPLFTMGDSGVTYDKCLWPLIVPLGFIMLIMAGIFWQFSRIYQNAGIGVLREWVIVRNTSGKTAIGRGIDIVVLPNAIEIAGVTVNLGQGHKGKSLYDESEIKEWLKPCLLNAAEIKGVDIFIREYRKNPLRTVLLIIACVLMLVADLVMKLH